MAFYLQALLLLSSLGLLHAKYWVSYDKNGKLVYDTTVNGDQIIDFSSVGYLGKNAPLPKDVPIKVTLHPSAENNGQALQDAINHVSTLPMDLRTGFRGAIHLSPGSFDMRGHYFKINSSGIVIRGSKGTVFHASMLSDRKPLFSVQGLQERVAEVGTRASVVSTVASGSYELFLNSTLGLEPGNLVQLMWPQSTKWIQMMNMTYWWGNYRQTSIERTIVQVDHCKNKVLLDIQVPFRIDLNYLNDIDPAYVVKISVTGRLEHIGLESFTAIQDKVAPYGGGIFLNMGGVQDAWVKDVTTIDFGGDTVTLTGKRITFDRVQLIRTIPAPPLGPKPADLAIAFPGTQILVKNSVITGDNEFNYMTRDGANGPNVFFNSTGFGTAHAEPHSHFATGILYDNMVFPSGGSIDLVKRTSAHHGYTSAYSVVWNSRSDALNVISPPQAANWAIGCSSRFQTVSVDEKPGFIEALGIQSPKLSSLFLAQSRVKML